MRNTINSLNLVLNHDSPYHFNIKMTFDTTINEVATLCILKLKKNLT